MILLFGSSSMIGKAVIKYCKNFHYSIAALNKEECDCLNIESVQAAIRKYQPDQVISLVGFNGNISLNAQRPGDICGITVKANMNVMESCITHRVQKVLVPISSCAYGSTKDVLIESEFLDDKIHPSVEAHGYARRFLFIYGQQLNKQYGNRFIFPVLNNNFGPHDQFKNPDRLKVFGTLIKRFVEAKRAGDKEIVIWGSGKARREGLFALDSGRLLIKMLEIYEQYNLPLNLGLGTDISIYDLSHLIKYKARCEAQIKWDETKPEGQLRKLLDVTRAKELGLTPTYTLEEGIERTVEWYEKTYPDPGYILKA